MPNMNTVARFTKADSTYEGLAAKPGSGNLLLIFTGSVVNVEIQFLNDQGVWTTYPDGAVTEPKSITRNHMTDIAINSLSGNNCHVEIARAYTG